MTAIIWHQVGSRFYETGVDRGVLYVESNPGVEWPGLTSVVENPSGGEITPHYLDGVKYLQVASATEFEATINAYYSPVEFDPCDGIAFEQGLLLTDQPRKQFGLTYRSLVGNDTEGPDFGYKIHLVYNALATPTNHEHKTLSEQGDPADLSWSIQCKPVFMTGRKPLAHIIVDSTLIDPGSLLFVERALYGTDSSAPYLPTPDQLIALILAGSGQGSSDLILDGGAPGQPITTIYDGGTPADNPSPIYDGGVA